MRRDHGTAPGAGRAAAARRIPPRRLAAVLAAPLLALAAGPLATPAAGQVDTAGPAPAPGLRLPVMTDTLANGLRVLALRRPGAPTASFVIRFDVGSVNEGPGQTGIAHLLEHLLFKGTTTIGTRDIERELALLRAMDAAQDTLLAGRPGGLDAAAEARLRSRIEMLGDSARQLSVSNEFSRILTGNGARDLNATTGYEQTTYYVRLPANRAELWFVLEADRMLNPVFREFYAERDVVAEERRTRVETSPHGRLLEAFYDAAYAEHPYGAPVIGRMADLRRHTRPDVAAYHARYYRPNNAVVAVVGDLDPQRVLDWARRYFGPIPPGREPPPVAATEPEQRGERRVEVRFDAEPALMVGWRVPSGFHDAAPAVSVLARVLGGGSTSRLHRRLVIDDRLASSVSVSVGPGFRGPRLVTVSAQPLEGTPIEELETAIYDEIAGLVQNPPTALELARVRNQLEGAEVRRLASNLGLAFQLVESTALYGDWRETFRVGERLARVTAEDVRRVVQTYLTADNRTVAVLVPADGAAGAERSARESGGGR